MLTSAEEQRLVETRRHLQNRIQLRLVLTDDPRSDAFQTYCSRLTALVPEIQVKQEKETGTAPPAIGMGRALIFHALPRGTELPPFTDLLVAQSALPPKPLPVPAPDVFEAPAMFKIYVSPSCPFCPVVLKELVAAASVNPAFHLSVIDAALFPEMAENDTIKSVPTLILDGTFRWTGVVDMDDVRQTARHRDPSKLSLESLRSMILNGDAFQLVGMMVREQNIFPAFFGLLTHAEFSARLGAMAAAEELAEQDRGVALRLVGPLVERFEPSADTVKGDILYVVGKAGDRGALPFLKRVAAGSYPDDVKEAAREAMQDIHHRKSV